MDRDFLDEIAAVYQSTGNLMDSKVSHLDDLLAERLEMAFHQPTSKYHSHDIAKIACEHSAIDLAYAANRLPSADRLILFENLSNTKAKIEFLINTDSGTRAAVFRHITDQESKDLIESMAPDDAITVLEDVSEKRFRRIVDLLPPKKGLGIKELKKHHRKSAGRLMTNDFFSFGMDVTIGQAASFIRENPGIDFTRRVFVLNQAKQLQGYVPARNMIVNPPHLTLRQVMRPIFYKVKPESTREEVVDLVERYKISGLPIVDDEDHLLGVVTYEDVVEAMEDIADETIARMAGTVEKVSDHFPIYKRFLSRAPWLFVTLLAGLVNVLVISSFQSKEGGVLTFVLFFVPLITGMSGNIGIQCSTILVRGMAIGTVSSGIKGEMVLKEIAIGMTSALVFGVLCSFFIFGLNHFNMINFEASPLIVGAIVGMGLLGACLAGTLLGVFSPLFFARLGIDPAVASGPIITAFNDFLSMSIYFLIAMGLGALLF
jgi:magnesium transporter